MTLEGVFHVILFFGVSNKIDIVVASICPARTMAPIRLYVGVDLGTALTGVAYAAPGDKVIRTIRKWPGIERNEPKVPTRLLYRGDRLVGWGFDRPEDFTMPDTGQKTRVVKGFKLGIDPRLISEYATTTIDVGSRVEVYKYYVDFLNCLYHHIREDIAKQDGFASLRWEEAWSQAQIEFVFSIPNVYGPHIISKYTELISETPFRNHISIVNMTESQAAVVWVSRRLNIFEVILHFIHCGSHNIANASSLPE